MKQLFLVMASLCLISAAVAQTDTIIVKRDTVARRDTIRIGPHLTIINGWSKKRGDSTSASYRERRRSSNLSTNWGILDLGFTNYFDNTNYASAEAQQFAPGASKDWFRVRTGKSVNVNIWIVSQKLNMIKHVVNLRYGFGLELNNYRYKEDIVFNTNPTRVVRSPIDYRKNKLAADYATVPLMLDFNFTPHKDKAASFGFAAGVSGGYLYSSRQKFKSGAEGKTKTHDDFDLRPYKLSYIAELTLGPVKVYGSKAMQSMFENGLDQTPYSVGLRFTNW